MQTLDSAVNESTNASTLILEGVHLNEIDEKYFFKRLNRLHALFPFDTFIELTIHQDHSYQEIYGKLKITALEWNFESEHSDLDIYKLYERLQSRIESEIRKWYRDWPMNRIGEVYYSMTNNDSTWRM